MNKTAFIYIDGVQKNTGSFLTPSNVYYNGAGYFGLNDNDAPNAFFDDVRIYNRALAHSEIQKVYKFYFIK